jgi:hypothetical protein
MQLPKVFFLFALHFIKPTKYSLLVQTMYYLLQDSCVMDGKTPDTRNSATAHRVAGGDASGVILARLVRLAQPVEPRKTFSPPHAFSFASAAVKVRSLRACHGKRMSTQRGTRDDGDDDDDRLTRTRQPSQTLIIRGAHPFILHGIRRSVPSRDSWKRHRNRSFFPSSSNRFRRA